MLLHLRNLQFVLLHRDFLLDWQFFHIDASDFFSRFFNCNCVDFPTKQSVHDFLFLRFGFLYLLIDFICNALDNLLRLGFFANFFHLLLVLLFFDIGLFSEVMDFKGCSNGALLKNFRDHLIRARVSAHEVRPSSNRGQARAVLHEHVRFILGQRVALVGHQWNLRHPKVFHVCKLVD